MGNASCRPSKREPSNLQSRAQISGPENVLVDNFSPSCQISRFGDTVLGTIPRPVASDAASTDSTFGHSARPPKMPQHSPPESRDVISLISDSEDEDSYKTVLRPSGLGVTSPRSAIAPKASNWLDEDLPEDSRRNNGYHASKSGHSLGNMHGEFALLAPWTEPEHNLRRTAHADVLDIPAMSPADLHSSPIWSEDWTRYSHSYEKDNYEGLCEMPNPTNAIDMKVHCVDEVLVIFPDICRDYVSELYDEGVGKIAAKLVEHILDKLEEGTQYPLSKDTLKSLKRKRQMAENEESEDHYKMLDRGPLGTDYYKTTRLALSAEFAHTPVTFINATLRLSNQHLFPAYEVLEEAERTWDPANPPYNKIKSARKVASKYTPSELDGLLGKETATSDTMLALRELTAARRIRAKADEQRRRERQAEMEEEENTRRAEKDGTMTECGCCYSDYPLNRMVHCNSEQILHWFCRGCARQAAENEIGNSKYVLNCISMDNCNATFSHDQKKQFLDEKSIVALDRNEQEAVLRIAGIENLESCPFCPFAAEYPPVEEDRLFRCQAPDCEKVSCRLCKLESHIPKTCEEFAKENGLNLRRQVEEAMSAALIRRCNKCGTPFVKEEGCNKMTCTRNGCGNVQCYVCSKSCSYDHFNDRSRGGRAGNCPLFESVFERHDQEVKNAEKEALAKVRAEHPEYTDEDLKIKVSEKVTQDEDRRRANDPRIRNPQLAAHPYPGNVFPVRDAAHQPLAAGGIIPIREAYAANFPPGHHHAPLVLPPRHGAQFREGPLHGIQPAWDIHGRR